MTYNVFSDTLNPTQSIIIHRICCDQPMCQMCNL